MNGEEFFEAIKAIGKEKNVSEDELLEGVGKSLISAIKGGYGKNAATFEIDKEKKEIKILIRKKVVKKVRNPNTETTKEQARLYKEDVSEGDIITMELETQNASRLVASKGRNVIRQAIREAELSSLRKDLISKNRKIVTGKVVGVDPFTHDASIEIGGRFTETLLREEQAPKDDFKKGDFVKVYVADVWSVYNSSRASLSRIHPDFVKRLLEIEVPEISDGTVEVKAVAREAGIRSKAAVYSRDENVDPVGACIGPRSSRINKIVEALDGEKLDIVRYSENPAEFVAAALSPAKVSSASLESESARYFKVKVPESQLSLAIGNRGLNVRLASLLTGWRINVVSETKNEPTIDLDE